MTAKAFTIAKWEFVERAKKKSFIIGLLLTPMIMVLFGVGPTLMQSSLESKDSEAVTVLDGTNLVFDSLKARIERSNTLKNGKPAFVVSKFDASHGSAAAAKQELDTLILADKIKAAIIIPSNVFDSLNAEYRAKNVSDIQTTEKIEKAISTIISEHKLAHAGLDPKLVKQLNKSTDLRTVRVTEKGEKESGFLESFGISYVFLIMMMIMILTSGQILVRSLVEEKSNRIVEVLVSSCSPTDLMFGKIIGLSMLGIVQMLVWAVIGAAVILSTHITNLPLDNIWIMTVYALLGFIMYAGLFVALGCLASTEQEAQQMTGYLSILLMLPFVIAFVVTQNPNSPILMFVTLIPFLTPSMMIMRLPVLTPPLWEIALTLGILIATTWAIIWAAGKIFRVGILLTGKRPSLDEIVKWIRS